MTNRYLWERIAGPDPSIRAADADRERTADRLRTSHAEGRLDMTEFQERLEQCYQAKTLGELALLVRDLPRPDEQLERSQAGLLARRWRLGSLAPILILLILVAALTGHHHVFWLWIPLLFLIWRMSWWRRRRFSTNARHRPDGWI